MDFGHGIVLFWYWKPFWDQTLGQHILSLWHFLSWTLVFLESLGLSPGVIFFVVDPISIFGPCTGNLFGTKICGDRSIYPMVTKLSGFGQYLGRNLMNVENLDFWHGIYSTFLVLETFLWPKFAERDPFVQWWPNFQDLVSI